MSPWFRDLLTLPAPAFWDGLHARLSQTEMPLDLTVGDLKRAWRKHPIQPAQGWILNDPRWVEDWLHYGPAGQDRFWQGIAREHPDVLWGGSAAQIQTWAHEVPEQLASWGGATVWSWVALAQAHPHPEHVSPWLRGVWTQAALFEALDDPQDAAARIPMAQETVRPWLDLGVRLPPLHPLLKGGYPAAFMDALFAAERAADLRQRPAAPHSRPRRRA